MSGPEFNITVKSEGCEEGPNIKIYDLVGAKSGKLQ
jgi:hypothetical protein